MQSRSQALPIAVKSFWTILESVVECIIYYLGIYDLWSVIILVIDDGSKFARLTQIKLLESENTDSNN